MSIENSDLARKVNHLHHASTLRKLAAELISKMVTEHGPRLEEVTKRGVFAADYGNECVVECLGQKFPLKQRYVWLEASNTLGMELRVDGSDEDRPLAKLLIRPDGKALIWGEREFNRTVDAVGFDDTCAAFLWDAADRAAVALQVVKY